MRRDQTINWPPDSNRDSIAKDLDSLRLSAELRLALRAIFEVQWPPDKPPDWKPGHALVKVPLRLINAETGTDDKRTAKKIVEQLAAEGAIQYQPSTGKPWLFSLDWDNLFGVDAAWRTRPEPPNAPVHPDSCTGASGNAPVHGVAEMVATALAQAAAAITTLNSLVQVLTLGTTQSGLIPTPRRSEPVVATGDDPEPSSAKDAPVHCENAPVHASACTGAFHEFMNHESSLEDSNTFMNHERQAVDAPVHGSDASVATLVRPKRVKALAETWSFRDPYREVTREHLLDPYHVEVLFTQVHELGVLRAGEVSREKWSQMARYAAGDGVNVRCPGAAFHRAIDNIRRARPKPPMTREELMASIARMPVAECLALLKGDFASKQRFLDVQKTGQDPRLNQFVRADLARALKRTGKASGTQRTTDQ